jgi:uncharacterized protein involved in exopolysaccharide biosynthesis
MNQYSDVNEGTSEFSLDDIIQAGARFKGWIAGIVSATAIAGILVAVIMRPVYRATIVVVPAETMTGADKLAGLGGQLGGLAALAGAPVPSSIKIEEALAILESRQFAERFINAHSLLPLLFAGMWDSESQRWQVEGESEAPSIQDGMRLLQNSIRTLNRDRNTGLISLHIDWFDPVQAATWANNMVAMANRHLRDRAIQEAEESIKYLNNELERTNSLEIRSAIYKLMETEIQNIMYANVLDEYAFKIVDPAMSPEADDYIRPNRLVIIILSLMAGALLSVMLATAAAIRTARLRL